MSVASGSDNSQSENSRSGSPDESYSVYELEALTLLPTLPRELQNRILEYCDMNSLHALCLLSKEWYDRAIPLLWGDIDFVTGIDDVYQVETARHFFATCDSLMEESPERWQILASRVRGLNLGRLHGMNIVKEKWDFCDEYIFFEEHDARVRKVFDIIAQFKNLERLSFYLKNWWGFDELGDVGTRLARGIKNLKSLEIGGQVPLDIIQRLLTTPENLEHLALINLIDSPGQDDGPEAIIGWLPAIQARFTSLKTLHLCKLADLDGRLSDGEDDDDNEDDEEGREYASGMRWKFPRESEVSTLEEWRDLLLSTSRTLKEVTLENKYLCGSSWDDSEDGIDPGVTHPAEYGAFSLRESKEILFPALGGEWPKLEKLTLIGMGEVEDVKMVTSHLEPRVRVEQRVAGMVRMAGDVTPQQISTPEYFLGLD